MRTLNRVDWKPAAGVGNLQIRLISRWLAALSPLLVSLCLANTRASAGELAVITDFSGGSADLLQIDQDKRLVRLNPTGHQDRGWVCWWYFKLTGVEPGETVTVDVGEGVWATPDRAAFSLDHDSWQQTAPGSRHGKRIVYRQRIDASECWFAWGPPFVLEDAQRLVQATASGRQFVDVLELCRTRADRPVPALVIKQGDRAADKRHGIWIQARQHAWESGSSWVCRGLVQWITSDDPRAVKLRESSHMTIVPIMDVDNVEIGAGGKNQKPQDHNRDWSDSPHWNSVRAAMERIAAADRHGQFDLFIDLHNPSAGDRNPYYYVSPTEELAEVGRANLERFVAATKDEMVGPFGYRGRVVVSGAGYDRNWLRISKNWVAMHTRDHVVAVTLETPWNTPHSTTDGYQQVGRQLGLAIARYFQQD